MADAMSENSWSDSLQPLEFEKSVKDVADSSCLKAVPSKFNFTNESSAFTADALPVVDFSALSSGDPHQRSKAIDHLATTCQEWGFFILVNHGIPESLMNATLTAVKEFFYLPDSVKKQFEAKSVLDPIQCGNLKVTTASNQSFTLWRDYLKLCVHPQFHCPHQPYLLREAVMDYSERIRKLCRKLMEAICDAVELDQQYMDQVLEMDSTSQIFVGNYYPPCPQPDQAIGIPPHTDTGLFTFLINNGVVGLQIQHDGKWFDVHYPPNSILVNVDDHLEIFTNGRCKSLNHRAVVNKERERVSVAILNGPSFEAVVGPAAPLVEKDGRAMYNSMKYKDFLELKLTKSRLGDKSFLEKQRT
ncbi:2-oxoglutarate-dependent dioxygenase 19-like [Salvia miltiorrhiza]|uniref:2-oxoglutarate-dependent dioxygenase 19-like n=1 Tax=Salvia miltiorrhiza TaxID=226208 RepID=UPI0025AD830B|nr:2-oxoglutarate-dependent dioxygenase 19-like [Salvia miltiorrhiza]